MRLQPGFLVIVLLLPLEVLGGHFNGGTIRWVPVDANDTTSPIQVRITQTYMYTLSTIPNTTNCTMGSLLSYGSNLYCTANCNTSGGYIAPSVRAYATGSSSTLNICYTQRTDVVNLTANDYFTISYNSSSGTYRSLNSGTSSGTVSAIWSISTDIDIRRRPDGLINTPPIANLMSPTGIPYNISTLISIPTADVNGDNVRCRWSTGPVECGGVCFPVTIPASTSLSNDCVLNITGTVLSGWYCAAIQVRT